LHNRCSRERSNDVAAIEKALQHLVGSVSQVISCFPSWIDMQTRSFPTTKKSLSSKLVPATSVSRFADRVAHTNADMLWHAGDSQGAACRWQEAIAGKAAHILSELLSQYEA